MNRRTFAGLLCEAGAAPPSRRREASLITWRVRIRCPWPPWSGASSGPPRRKSRHHV